MIGRNDATLAEIQVSATQFVKYRTATLATTLQWPRTVVYLQALGCSGMFSYPPTATNPLGAIEHVMKSLVCEAGRIFVGTAGWSLPHAERGRFAPEGTHLARYAQALTGVEINSSFYRPHATTVYSRWAAATPEGFRFSVKMPRTITHEKRLLDCEELLCTFLDQTQGLGDRLGCILIQLPPSFAYDASLAGAFFEMFRAIYDGALALEPRHASWFADDAAELLADCNVGRVAADPARVPAAAAPGGTPDLVYFRLHGSPRVYWSRYEDQFLDKLCAQLVSAARLAKAVWCIFDNTASGAATSDALGVRERLAEGMNRWDAVTESIA